MANQQEKVDVNTPVTNPELVAAFENYDASNPESEPRLREMLAQATFLAPFTPENFETTDSEDGKITILPGSIMAFYARRTDEGAFLTIATDWDGINNFLPVKEKPVNGSIMPAIDIWEWVTSKNSSYVGVEILTKKQAYSLRNSYIETLLTNSEN